MAPSVKLIMYCEIASSSFLGVCLRSPSLVASSTERPLEGGCLTQSEAKDRDSKRCCAPVTPPSCTCCQAHHTNFTWLKKVQVSISAQVQILRIKAKAAITKPCTYMGGIVKPWQGHHDVDVCLMSAF